MDKNITSMDIKDPGLRSLPPGVERYLVKGGGLSIISLDPDDKIEITDTEGKQKCEVIVFNKDGKPDCSLLGLKEKNEPKDIKKILSEKNESAFHLRVVATTLLITKIIRPSLFKELVNSSISQKDFDEYFDFDKKYIEPKTSTGEYNPEFDSALWGLYQCWQYILTGGTPLNNQYPTNVLSAFNQYPSNCEAKQTPQWVNENYLNTFKLS